RRGRSAVGQVHEGKHIGFTKGEVQGLQFAAESFNQRFRDLTSLGAAILQNALRALRGVRHLKQILRHDALQSDVTSSSTSAHSLEPYTQSSRALSAGGRYFSEMVASKQVPGGMGGGPFFPKSSRRARV